MGEPAVVVASGLALGAVYGLVGVAVAVAAVATRTLFLAVGPVLVAGVLTRFALATVGVPDGLATLAGIAGGAAAGALLAPAVVELFGRAVDRLLGMAAAGVVIEVASARWLGTATLRPEPLLELPAAGPVQGDVVTALVLGIPLALALAAALRVTRWGRRVRIVGGSDAAAEQSGIPPAVVRAGALAVAGAVAVTAGLLAAPIALVRAGQGAVFTVTGVAAALLLSRRGVAWALPAGLAIGLAEAVGQSLWPAAGGQVAIGIVVLGALAVVGPPTRAAWQRAW